MGDIFMLDSPQVVVPQPRTALADEPHLPECRSIGEPRWAVATCRPRADRWAQFNLHRLGYTCYRPTYAVRVASPHGGSHVETRSLFPGYLFIRFDAAAASWSPIRDTPGVADLVRAGPSVAYARPGAVEALQATDELRAIPTPASASWAPGMPCSPATGVLAGAPAVVVDTNGLVATVAVMMLGQLRHVSVPVDSLVGRDDARG